MPKLWRHDRALFLFFAGFTAAFIFLNYKWGITAAPINQYGMYSGRYFLSDTQTIYHINVNGDRLNVKDLDITQRDFLFVSADNYIFQKDRNENVFKIMAGFYSSPGTGNHTTKSDFEDIAAPEQFCKWYNGKLAALTGAGIDSSEILSQQYVLRNGSLQPVLRPKIICKCY